MNKQGRKDAAAGAIADRRAETSRGAHYFHKHGNGLKQTGVVAQAPKNDSLFRWQSVSGEKTVIATAAFVYCTSDQTSTASENKTRFFTMLSLLISK